MRRTDDEIVRIREQLAKRKAWPQACAILGALEAAEDDAPIPTNKLCRITRSNSRKVYGYIKQVREYLELVEGKKLCSLRGVGYWIGTQPKHDLTEALKEGQRMISHGKRLVRSIGILEENTEAMTPDDAKIYGMCCSLGSTARVLSNQYNDVKKMVNSRDAEQRMLLAEKETRAPLAELIGAGSPAEDIKEAMHEAGVDDEDEGED